MRHRKKEKIIRYPIWIHKDLRNPIVCATRVYFKLRPSAPPNGGGVPGPGTRDGKGNGHLRRPKGHRRGSLATPAVSTFGAEKTGRAPSTGRTVLATLEPRLAQTRDDVARDYSLFVARKCVGAVCRHGTCTELVRFGMCVSVVLERVQDRTVCSTRYAHARGHRASGGGAILFYPLRSALLSDNTAL